VGIGRYLLAVACGAVAFVPLSLGARSLRRRFMPDVSGPTAVLAEIVVGLALVVSISELLGSIGLFRLAPVTVAFACAGAVAWRIPGNSTTHEPRDPAGQPATILRVDWREGFAALVAVAVTGAAWSARVADSVQRGMVATADTLWYHMPVAARFTQTGWTPWLHYSDGNSLTVFFPANSELVHAIGILFVGNDLLSPFLNIFWLGLALLAAWCIGERFGVAPVTLVGVAAVLATPELVLDDAGSALNDVVSVALFLSAIALLVAPKNSHDQEPQQGLFVCAALAAGLALGTKYTVIPAVGVVSLAAVILSRPGTRLRQSALWATGLALTGGYWYFRNLIAVGNPLPTLHAGVGPLHLPNVPFPNSAKVADYLFDGHAWNDYLLPGLREALGPAWWALLVLLLGGLLLGVFRGQSNVVRALAIVGLAAFVAFLYSPQILRFGRNPIYFVVNVRYVAPALVVGAVVLPIAATRFGRPAVVAVLAAYGGVLVAMQIDSSIWGNAGTRIARQADGSWPRVWGAAAGLAILLGGLAWRYAARRSPARISALRACSAAVAVLLVGGYFLEERYLANRYTNAPPMPQTFRWARDVHDARIAFVGFIAQYPLYGNDLSNYVQYVAHRAADRTSSRIADCTAWRRAINDGRYTYVVATTPGFPFPSKQPALEAGWTRSDPAAHVVLEESNLGAHAWLFKINGKLDPTGCAPQRRNRSATAP